MVSIPLIIHLFAKKKYTEIPFSTLFFLKVSHKKSVKNIAIHNLLLLLLRMLCIALFTFAFINPVARWTKLRMFAVNEPQSVFLILDNSVSMQFEENAEKVFDRGKATTLRILKALSPEDNVFFMFTNPAGSEPKFTIYSSFEDGRSQIMETIENAKIVFSTADILSLIKLSCQKLSTVTTATRKIIIISDMQKYSFYSKAYGANTETASTDLDVCSNAIDKTSKQISTFSKPEITFIDVSLHLENFFNFSIKDISAPTIVFTEKPTSICFTLKNYTKTLKNIQTTLNIGGIRREQKVFRIAGRKLEKKCFYTTFPKTQIYTGNVSITGDALPFDNTVYFRVNALKTTNVLFLQDKQISGLQDFKNSDNNVELFLQSAFDAQILQDMSIKPEFKNIDVIGSNKFAPDKYKVVVLLTDLKLVSPKTMKYLINFIQKGVGGLFILKNSQDIHDAFEPFSESLGRFFEIPAPHVVSAEQSSSNLREKFFSISYINFSHPVFSIFNNIDNTAIKTQLTNIRFFNPVQLFPNHIKTNTLIKLSNANPLLLESIIGKGRLLTLGSGLSPVDTDLCLKPIFVPLLYNILHYLISGTSAKENLFYTGKPVRLVLKNNYVASPKVKNEKDNHFSNKLNTVVRNFSSVNPLEPLEHTEGKVFIKNSSNTFGKFCTHTGFLSDIDSQLFTCGQIISGEYEVLFKPSGKKIKNYIDKFVVNVDTEEGNLEKITSQDVKKILSNTKFVIKSYQQVVGDKENAAGLSLLVGNNISSNIPIISLAPFFTIGFIICLLLEVLIA